MDGHEPETGRGPLQMVEAVAAVVGEVAAAVGGASGQGDGDHGGAAVVALPDPAGTQAPPLAASGHDSADLDAAFGELYHLRQEVKDLRDTVAGVMRAFDALHTHHLSLMGVLKGAAELGALIIK